MNDGEIVVAEAPIGHDLDQSSLSHEVGLNNRRKIADSAARGQDWRQACKVVHGKMGLKSQSFSINPVLVNEGPAIFGAPIRKCEKTVLEKVPRALRRLARLEIGRARDQLMPVCQYLPGDERRIL